MWISDPMPVMTRIITDASGSRRSVNPAVKSPDAIHVNTWLTIARDSCAMPSRRHTESSDTTNDPPIAAQATAPDTGLLRRRPRKALTRNPRNGSSGISSNMSRRGNAKRAKHAKITFAMALCGVRGLCVPRFSLPFQRRERIRVERLFVAEKPDDDGEADGGFGGGHGHHEKDDDLPIGRPQRAPEGDKRQVHGVQHDFDRQEDRDQVAPQEHARRADRKQNRRQHQVLVEGDHQRWPSLRARTTAPSIATRIRIDVTSNAKA